MYTYKNFLTAPLSFQVSDPRESITRFDDRCTLAVGGFADSDRVGTHYARLKDDVNIPTGTRFWMTAVIELPADFYEKQTASLKLMTCGDSVGPYQRIGLWIDSDGFPRLQSETEGMLLQILWKGRLLLPTGKHQYALEIVPSAKDGEALLRLYEDGLMLGESTKANYRAPAINRLVWGIDGAASQDTKRMTLILWQVGLDDYIPQVDPCIAKRKRLARAKIEARAARLEWLAVRDRYNTALEEYRAALEDVGGC